MSPYLKDDISRLEKCSLRHKMADKSSFCKRNSWVRGGVLATTYPRPSHILHTFSSEPNENARPPSFLF